MSSSGMPSRKVLDDTGSEASQEFKAYQYHISPPRIMRHSPTHPEPWVQGQGESMSCLVTCFPNRPVSVAVEPLLGVVLLWPCLDLCAAPEQHLPREP